MHSSPALGCSFFSLPLASSSGLLVVLRLLSEGVVVVVGRAAHAVAAAATVGAIGIASRRHIRGAAVLVAVARQKVLDRGRRHDLVDHHLVKHQDGHGPLGAARGGVGLHLRLERIFRPLRGVVRRQRRRRGQRLPAAQLRLARDPAQVLPALSVVGDAGGVSLTSCTWQSSGPRQDDTSGRR